MAEKRRYLFDERSAARAYSRAVITTGGRTIWLAGQTASATGEFEAQVRDVFTKLDATIKSAGGTGLRDMVTMTVFITDPRYGDEFVAIRKQYFTRGFPGSALITVHSLARPEMLVEVQAVAALDA